MTQKVEIELDAKEAGAVRAWLAVQRAADGYTGSLGKIDTATSKVAKSAGEYDAAMARYNQLMKAAETPQQKHNRNLEAASKLLHAGKIGQDEFAASVKRSNSELAATKPSSDGWLDSIGPKLTTAAAGYLTVGAAVNGIGTTLSTISEANRQFLADVKESASEIDGMFKGLQVQMGLNELKAAEAKDKVLDNAEKVGANPKFAEAAARQMVSSGFSNEDATGEGHLDFLKAAAASGELGSDPKALVQSTGQFLAAMNLEKNSANLKKVLVGTQRLSKTGDTQLTDLTNLSGKVQSFSGKISADEVLGTFDVLRAKTGPDTASTALKIFGDRLMGSKGDKEREAQLSRMGLKPEQVDFQGEGMSTVLETLAKGMERVKPTEREGVLQKLFGTEASSPIAGLIRDRELVPKAVSNLSDQAGFDADVEKATSGRTRGEERQKIRRMRSLAAKDTQTDLLRSEVVQAQVDAERSPLMQWMAGNVFDATRFAGLGSYVGADDDGFAASVAHAVTNPKNMNILTGIGSATVDMAPAATTSAKQARTAVAQRMAPSEQQKPRLILDAPKAELPKPAITIPAVEKTEPARTELRAELPKLSEMPRTEPERPKLTSLAIPAVERLPQVRTEPRAEPKVERPLPTPPVNDPAMTQNNSLLQQSIGLQKQQLDELKKRPQPVVNMRPNTTPAAPVASAALGNQTSQRP